MVIFPSIWVILICSYLLIVIFSNLITGVLNKLITVIFSHSPITDLSYSISPILSNLIIIIYTGFIADFYFFIFCCKFEIKSFTSLKLKYFIFLKLLHNIINENNLIISTFNLHGFPWWKVNLFSFSPF